MGIESAVDISALPLFSQLEFLPGGKEITTYLDRSVSYFRSQQPSGITTQITYVLTNSGALAIHYSAHNDDAKLATVLACRRRRDGTAAHLRLRRGTDVRAPRRPGGTGMLAVDHRYAGPAPKIRARPRELAVDHWEPDGDRWRLAPDIGPARSRAHRDLVSAAIRHPA